MSHFGIDIFWVNKYVFKTPPKLPGGMEQARPETLTSLVLSLTDNPQLAFLLQHCSCTSCSTKNIQQRCCRTQVSRKTSFCVTLILNFLHPFSGQGTSNYRTDFCAWFSDRTGESRTYFHVWFSDGEGNMQYRSITPYFCYTPIQQPFLSGEIHLHNVLPRSQDEKHLNLIYHMHSHIPSQRPSVFPLTYKELS